MVLLKEAGPCFEELLLVAGDHSAFPGYREVRWAFLRWVSSSLCNQWGLRLSWVRDSRPGLESGLRPLADVARGG